MMRGPSDASSGSDEDSADKGGMDEPVGGEEWRQRHVQRGLFWTVVAVVCAILIRYLIVTEEHSTS